MTLPENFLNNIFFYKTNYFSYMLGVQERFSPEKLATTASGALTALFLEIIVSSTLVISYLYFSQILFNYVCKMGYINLSKGLKLKVSNFTIPSA